MSVTSRSRLYERYVKEILPALTAKFGEDECSQLAEVAEDRH